MVGQYSLNHSIFQHFEMLGNENIIHRQILIRLFAKGVIVHAFFVRRAYESFVNGLQYRRMGRSVESVQ